MIVAVIVGARKRAGTKNLAPSLMQAAEEQLTSDKLLLSTIISNLLNKYKRELGILTYAGDDGVGKIVKELCIERNIKCGEQTWYFHGSNRWETAESGKCYVARSATMLEIGDLFVVLPDDTRHGIVEDLVSRLQTLRTLEEHGKPSALQARPYVVLSEQGAVLEKFKEGAIL